MCTRYALTTPHSEVLRLFRPERVPDCAPEFPQRYNIAPTHPIGIVRLDPVGRSELALVRWGFVPAWVKNPAEFTLLLNARGETCHEKPSFRAAMTRRRCLVPASGYYEWTGPAKAKQPYLIERTDGAPMAFAGLWENWLGADGSEFESAAIITVQANATTAVIHDRMPAILAPAAFAAWLDVRGVAVDAARLLLQPAPETLLTLRPVSKRLGNPRFDDPSVQDPPQDPPISTLF